VTRVIICCGAGGVGKTTISAAIALRAAWEGHRVAALTIDPARRLADSLGLSEVGNIPRNVPIHTLQPDPGIAPAISTSRAPGGLLDVMMLDAKSAFDAVILSYAPTPEAAQRILENRYYRFTSSKLAGSQEYMAMVRLHDLVTSARYDLIVLDTPPTRHALDFLHAPDRIGRVMDQRVLKVLALGRTNAGIRRLYETSSSAMRVLDRLVGLGTIEELGDFVAAFEGMTERFRQRSTDVARLFHAAGTSLLLVTSPSPTSQAEAEEFLTEILADELPFRGLLVNRVTPRPRLARDGSDLPTTASTGLDEATWDALLGGMRRALAWTTALADADAATLAPYKANRIPLWTIPAFEEDIHDVEAILSVGLNLPSIATLTGQGDPVSVPAVAIS